MPEFQTDDAILVDYIEHFLLHYLIVLAETTTPNHGMIVPLIQSGLSIKESKDYWDKIVKDNASKYNIEYITGWTKRLTI